MDQKILDLRVDWVDAYGNSPRWMVLLNHTNTFAHNGEPLWERSSDGTHWRAEKGIEVDYFGYHGEGLETDRNEGGYGGHCYEITMKNGSKRILKGPWSSRAALCNLVFPNHAPCVEVSITTDLDDWNSGMGYCTSSGDLLESAILAFLREQKLIIRQLVGAKHNAPGRWVSGPIQVGYVSHAKGDGEKRLMPIRADGTCKGNYIVEVL